MDFCLAGRSSVGHCNVLGSRFRGFDLPGFLLICISIGALPHVLLRLWLQVFKTLLHFSQSLIKTVLTVTPDVLVDLRSRWVG